jgi:translation initiation factor IF-2
MPKRPPPERGDESLEANSLEALDPGLDEALAGASDVQNPDVTRPDNEVPDPAATPPMPGAAVTAPRPRPQAARPRLAAPPAPAPRPAPARPTGTSTTPALKPSTGVQPALSRPTGATSSAPAFKPATGQQPALSRPSTSSTPAHKPSAPPPKAPGLFDSIAGALKVITGSRPAVERPAAATNPAHKPVTAQATPSAGSRGVVPKQQATGATPAYRPATSSTPALTPGTGSFKAAPRPSTGTFAPLPPRPEDTIAPAANAAELQREIRARSLGGGSSSPSGVRPAPSLNKPAPRPVADDTFVKRKMKEAETNLPDFDFDFPDDDAK